MSVRTDITPKAIAQAADHQRAEANAAGTAVKDLTAARDLIARDVEELARQVTWWETRAPGSQVRTLIAQAHEERSADLAQADGRITNAARAQQDHERAAAELDALALAARAEWEQRQATTTRTDLTQADHPDEPAPARTEADEPAPTGYPDKPAGGTEAK